MKKFLVCALALMCVASVQALETKPTIKIGVVFPLTGNNAYMGEMGRAGMEMRLRELGKDNKFRYQVIYEDDGFVFSKTAMAVKKLKDIDKVDVMMTMWGYGSDIALPQLKDSKILHVNVDRWTEGAGERDFVVGASVEAYVSHLVNVLRAMKVKKVAYIGTAEQGKEIMRKKMVGALASAEIELLDSTSLSAEVRDLRPSILKIQEMNPDYVVNCLDMPAAQIFLKQVQETSFQIPVGNMTAAVFEVDSTLTHGQWAIHPAVPNPEWSAKFKAQFKKDGNYPAPQFYNTLSMIINAYEKLDASKKPTSDEVAQSIRSLGSFEGATGTLTFAAPNRYEAPVSYFVFQNGTAQPMTLHELMLYYGKAK